MGTFAASTQTLPRPRVERAESTLPLRPGNSGHTCARPLKKAIVPVVAIAVKCNSFADPPLHLCFAFFLASRRYSAASHTVC